HQMLDEPVRLRLHAALGARDVAVAVEGELRLDALDRERALLRAALGERAGHLARRLQRVGPRLLRALVTGEDAVDAVVVEALVGADLAAVERRAADLGAGEVHLDGYGVAVLVRAQRARVVGQRLGQHGLDGPGDVDRSRALVRLAVDERARP